MRMICVVVLFVLLGGCRGKPTTANQESRASLRDPEIDERFLTAWPMRKFEGDCDYRQAIPKGELSPDENRLALDAATVLLEKLRTYPIPVLKIRNALANGLPLLERVYLSGSDPNGPPDIETNPNSNFIEFYVYVGGNKKKCVDATTKGPVMIAPISIEWVLHGREAVKRWYHGTLYAFSFGVDLAPGADKTAFFLGYGGGELN